MTDLTGMLKNPETITIITSGGLGDMLIVLCKLSAESLRRKCKFKIIRYDLYAQYDSLIGELVSAFGFAEFVTPSRTFESIDVLNAAIESAPFSYVDTKWKKTDQETYPFDYDSLNPFLNLKTEIPKVDRKRKNIGIQLFCGVEGHNFRGFSLDWLRVVRQRYPAKEFALWLFGSNSKSYDPARIAEVCSYLGIDNMVEKISFHAWMGYISAMGMYISLEGFSGLFSMSQKVPTLVYNQYSGGIQDSVHNAWSRNSRIVNLNSNLFLRKYNHLFNSQRLYSPSIPEDIEVLCTQK